MFVFFLSLFCIENVFSQYVRMLEPLGNCNPPSSGSGSECIWNCGHRLCEGVFYCGPNSTKCEVNCITENSCSEALIVISQSKGPTDVNCLSPHGSCKHLAVNCGDFNNNVLMSLQLYKFDRFRSTIHEYMNRIQGNVLLRSFFRPLQHYFTKKTGHYTRCSLNCGGDPGDSCEKASLSCNGNFDIGCQVNAKPSSNQGSIFKSGQFFCNLRNSEGSTGSCFLNCPFQSNSQNEISCIDTRYGCLPDRYRNQFTRGTIGKCYCKGNVCTLQSSEFLSRIINRIPPKPTFRPTVAPTFEPSPSPTKYPTINPTISTPKPTPGPVRPSSNLKKKTQRPTPKPTKHIRIRNPVRKIGYKPYLFDTMLEVFAKGDRKKFKGNRLECKSIKCEMKCHKKNTCNHLILHIKKSVLQFKLTCEGAESCVNIDVYSESKENQIECKGSGSCNKAHFKFGNKRRVITEAQKIEVQCQEGGCGKETMVNCGHDAAECLVQNSGGERNAFGGTLNCYSHNPNALCEMQCSSNKKEFSCIGATFNCFANNKKQCQCSYIGNSTSYNDCPKINYIQF